VHFIITWEKMDPGENIIINQDFRLTWQIGRVGLFSSWIKLYTVYFRIQIDIKFGIFRIKQFQIQYIYGSGQLYCSDSQVRILLGFGPISIVVNSCVRFFLIRITISYG
jgi:hypothetical protein